MENTSKTVEYREVKNGKQSFFDGGLAQFIGYLILGIIVTCITFGICYPWAFTMIYNWQIKHTVINGHRLAFNGTAIELFGKWIVWLFLSVITFGIYSFWLRIKLTQWKTKHTYFAN